jgi:hypothetical protein
MTFDALALQVPRLPITTGGRWVGGGEEVEQGVFGDADTAADADRTKLAAGDGLVELVAPDPQDCRGLAGGEYLGQRGQCAGRGGCEVRGRRWNGGRLATGAVARIGSGWPLMLLGASCCGRWRPALPAVDGGAGTIPRSRVQVWGVFPSGKAYRAPVRWRGEGERPADGKVLARRSPGVARCQWCRLDEAGIPSTSACPTQP